VIAWERRRRAVGVVASFFLHGLVLLAFEIRSSDPISDGPAREAVIEVTWWTGEEGQGATERTSALPVDTPTASPAAMETSDPDPVDTPRSATELPAAPSTRQVATLGDQPANAVPPSLAAISDGGNVSDRSEPTVERAPSASIRRQQAKETGAPRSGYSVEQRDRHALQQKARRASADVSRNRKSTEHYRPAEGARIAERVSSAGSATGGRLGTPGPRGTTGSPSELAAYLARVRARITSHQSAYGGEQGKVGIRFLVSADGSFTGLAAVSGDRGPLDDAALRVVRRASPAPPIPASLGRPSISVVVTIIFE